MARDLNYYRALPYTRRAEKRQEDSEHYWIAWIDELPGCKTDGSTCVEAMANLDVAFDDYIEAKMEFKSEIPLPEKLLHQGMAQALSTESALWTHCLYRLEPDDETPMRRLQSSGAPSDSTDRNKGEAIPMQVKMEQLAVA